MKEAEEDHPEGTNWIPSEEEIESAIKWFDEAVPEAAGLLNATLEESNSDDEEDHDLEIVWSRVKHPSIEFAASYNPNLFLTLLEQVGAFRAFERELEAQGSPTRIRLRRRGKGFGCDRHHTIKLEKYDIAIEGGQSFDAYDWVGIGEELDVYPEIEVSYKLADRAEKYFRKHLAQKLLDTLHQLLLESVYAANRETVPASKAREIEKITSIIDKCPSLQSRKPGRPLGRGHTAEKKGQQQQEFEKQIEETLKRLRNDLGRMPSKTKVAQELHLGGISPHTGNNTCLNAFNSKLKRLEVDYEKIYRRVELNK